MNWRVQSECTALLVLESTKKHFELCESIRVKTEYAKAEFKRKALEATVAVSAMGLGVGMQASYFIM